MADLPLWGSLQRASDDPETIEEAIARIVAEHETDPTAHLGTGESLEQHKTNEILDHPAGSVVADKSGSADIVFDVVFNTIDGFSHTGSGYVDISDFRLYMEVDSGHTPVYLSALPFTESQFVAPLSLILEAPCYFVFPNDTTAQIDWHIISFQIENNRVRGYNPFSEEYTDWFSVDMTQVHVLRAIYFNTDEKIKFYVDGVLFAEMDYTWVLEPTDMYLDITHTRGTEDGIFYVNKLRFGVFNDVAPS